MILYNTLMGVCAGGIMLLVAQLVRDLTHNELGSGTYGAALLALGVPLTVLGGAMTLTWPLNVNPPINIAFGEPSLLLGVLAVLAGVIMTKFSLNAATRAPTDDDKVVTLTHRHLRPIAWVIFFTGLVLLTTATAIDSYDLVGDAPPQEPIIGRFTGWENTFFAVIYALAGLGCVLTPWLRTRPHMINRIVSTAWTVSGLAFLLFSVLNYRTHIGLLINLERGTNYRW